MCQVITRDSVAPSWTHTAILGFGDPVLLIFIEQLHTKLTNPGVGTEGGLGS